jgi:ferredoxin-NADP reductase
MSIYLRLKRKNQTIFLHCDGNEKLFEIKKRLSALIDKHHDNIKLVEYLTEEQRQMRDLERKKQIAPPNQKKKSDQKQQQQQQQQDVVEEGFDEEKTLQQLGIDNDQIIFFICKDESGGVWEEIDVEKLQPKISLNDSTKK